jgi:hypothetical protein
MLFLCTTNYDVKHLKTKIQNFEKKCSKYNVFFEIMYNKLCRINTNKNNSKEKGKKKVNKKKHKTNKVEKNPKNERKKCFTKKVSFHSRLLIPNLQEGRVRANTSYYNEEQHKE